MLSFYAPCLCIDYLASVTTNIKSDRSRCREALRLSFPVSPISLSDQVSQRSLPQHSCKTLCPASSNFIVVECIEIELSERSALRQHSSKTLCPSITDLITTEIEVNRDKDWTRNFFHGSKIMAWPCYHEVLHFYHSLFHSCSFPVFHVPSLWWYSVCWSSFGLFVHCVGSVCQSIFGYRGISSDIPRYYLIPDTGINSICYIIYVYRGMRTHNIYDMYKAYIYTYIHIHIYMF